MGGWVGQAITNPISGPSLSFVFCLLALSLTIVVKCCCQIGIQHSHCILYAFFAFEAILSEKELALFVCQEEPAGPAFEAFLVKSLFFEQDALCVEEGWFLI